MRARDVSRPFESLTVVDEDEFVVLVDANGFDAGLAQKLQAHVDGLRHRAISVLIANSQGELLLQKRFSGKYHSGGLWTNACCSHPRAGEAASQAASRRLKDEMGFSVDLSPLFIVEYRAQVGELIEDEYVHVFGGRYEGAVSPDPQEVEDHRWVSLVELEADMAARPALYTPWFRKYLQLRKPEIAAFAAAAR